VGAAVFRFLRADARRIERRIGVGPGSLILQSECGVMDIYILFSLPRRKGRDAAGAAN
jgi:hypothetical protein